MILSIKGNWQHAELEHNLYLNNLIDKYLNKIIKTEGPPPAAYYFIQKSRHLITSKYESDLLNSITLLLQHKKDLKDGQLTLMSDLAKIFDYNKFTRKTGLWNAYALCRKSKARTCPYCNQAYAFTVQAHSGAFRPTLDHFFNKDEYPHLALSLYNLVPSCASCNSSLKGTKDFFLHPHLHPLFDENNISFFFSIKGDPSELPDAITSQRSDLKIQARTVNCCAKSQNALETFIINERYETLIVEATEFYLAKASLDEALVNSQLTLTFNEATLLRFQRNSSERYILGKMYADIYDTF